VVAFDHKAATVGRAPQSRDRWSRPTKPRPVVAPDKTATGGRARQNRDRGSRPTKPRPVVAPDKTATGGRAPQNRDRWSRPGGKRAFLRTRWRDHRSRLCESVGANACDVNTYGSFNGIGTSGARFQRAIIQEARWKRAPRLGISRQAGYNDHLRPPGADTKGPRCTNIS